MTTKHSSRNFTHSMLRYITIALIVSLILAGPSSLLSVGITDDFDDQSGTDPSVQSNQSDPSDHSDPRGILPRAGGLAPDQTSYSDWDHILQSMDLDTLHTLGYNGSGIRVGVIDNGVDLTHPGLSGRGFVEKSFLVSSGSTQTHGTPVAGAIVGSQSNSITGSAPGAGLYSAEMSSNAEDTVIDGNFTAAVEWLADQGVSVINLSFGGYHNWTAMIEIARQNNMIVVGSAGNDGSGSYTRPPSGPGADLYAIGVGALTYLDDPATYSSQGPTIDYYQKPDVAAAGSIRSTSVISGDGIYVGTSFSAPLVTGGIASVLSALDYYNKSWTVGGVKAAMLDAATPVAADISRQGRGLVNFTRMFELLNTTQNQAALLGQNLPEEFDTLPTGMVQNLPIQLVYNTSLTLSLGVSGTLADIVTYDTPSRATSLPFTYDGNLASEGIYSGYLVINHTSTVLLNQSLTLVVDNSFRGRIGVDYYHSNDFLHAESTLLDRDNSLAAALRDQGFWPEYILQSYDTLDLTRYSAIYIRNYMDVGSSSAETLYLSKYLSTTELDALAAFRGAGGRLLISTRSVDHQDTADLDALDSLLSVVAMQMDRDDTSNPVTTTRVINESNYARSTSLIQVQGQDIVGGQSLVDHGRTIVRTQTGAKAIVASDVLADDEFVEDIISWLHLPGSFVLDDMSQDNDALHVSYSTAISHGTPQVRHYTYSGEEVSTSTATVSSAGDNHSLSIALQDGLYTIEISDPLSGQYFKLTHRDHQALVMDPKLPVLELLNSTRHFTVNTSDPVPTTVAFLASDNYGIDRTEVEYSNKLLRVQTNSTTGISSFNLTAALFGSGPVLNITISAVDLAGNTKTIEISAELVSPSDPDTTIESPPDDESGELSELLTNLGDQVVIILVILFTLTLTAITGVYLSRKSP